MPEQMSSQIIWPRDMVAERGMVYESLNLLYRKLDTNTFGDQLGLIVSCTNNSTLGKNVDSRGLLHKVEITAIPDLAQARIRVTHEVLPGLHAASRIITANEQLKVAGFDKGCIMPIYNFGPNKTFNSDVRGRLSHHTGQISCLAAKATGDLLASGCTMGEITLYQVRESKITFLTRTTDTNSSNITDMSFLSSANNSHGNQVNENTLIYSNNVGQIYSIDTRCNLADPVQSHLIHDLSPRVSLTSIVPVTSKPGHLLCLGGTAGELLTIDLRQDSRCVYSREATSDKTIYRMKEISVMDGNNERSFLAYCNLTDKINILDIDTMKPADGWKCDRPPEGSVRDLIQVDDRIITCGDNVSIGCWKWENKSAVDRSK